MANKRVKLFIFLKFDMYLKRANNLTTRFAFQGRQSFKAARLEIVSRTHKTYSRDIIKILLILSEDSFQLRERNMLCSIIQLCMQGMHYPFYYMANWSKMKRRILIGSLSGPNFAIRTAKMDRSRISFGKLLFQNIAQKKTVFPSCLADDFHESPSSFFPLGFWVFVSGGCTSLIA